MPSTITTTEKFPKATVTKSQMDGLVALRLKAGAIRSSYENGGEEWVLTTEWNVLGE
jgi:hypothetical protein